MTRVVIIGGGPGGYEAALVAAQLGAEVAVVDTDGIGGSAVLTDCVPSKTLVATADRMVDVAESGELGVRVGRTREGGPTTSVSGVGVDLGAVNARVVELAEAQSADTARRLVRDGVRVVVGRGRLEGPNRVVADMPDGGSEVLDADVVLVATGAHPRELASAVPDGERILSWTQVYALD